MKSITFPRSRVREIEEIEPALKAALGDDYKAMSLNPREAIIYLNDNADETALAIAQKTFSDTALAIDHTHPAPSRRRAQKQNASMKAVGSTDLASLHTRIADANSVQALRAEVAALAQLVHRMALALNLNDTDVPGA